ncbi:MAG: DUF1801 domain-containing protein [Ardenticatenaceae bacterium]|nr:DUF1801 domain-containing protein [Anaerolineales bacterium]MCB8920259.1 DUF1801 domain-containing protein [Ardenticatenaceae bacterium]MCB9004931.1 DUF1801 domain-containing protein [Ardenticatenaceae bacterium]
MAELKTKLNDGSVTDYLNSITHDGKRQDSWTIVEMMQNVTGKEPKMWGDSIIGFGSYHYKYASGREGDWFVVGFAPRKQNLTLYIMPGFERYDGLMQKLGKHKTGKSCLYINKLTDIDMTVLEELVRQSVEHMEGN